MPGSPRRVLAQWLHRVALDASFREFVDGRTFRNPDTENDVLFDSLPKEEQAKIFRQWKDRNAPREKERGSPRGVIQVDKKSVRSKSKEMADLIVGMKFRDNDTSLFENRSQPWPVDVGRFKIKDVRGRTFYVPVKLEATEPPEEGWREGRSLVNGGQAEHAHGGKGHQFPTGVTIRLNRDKTPAELAKRRDQLEDEIYNVMIHELTHAQDVHEHPDQAAKRQQKHDEKDPKVYYNLPHEVRAFTQQVTDELEKSLERVYGNKEDPWFPDDNQLLEGLIGQSVTWDRIKRYLTPENRKKVLRSAYSAVSEYTKKHRKHASTRCV